MPDTRCDYLVLGSGISGMAQAVFLAETGASVVLLERSSVPGGSMQRFRRGGIGLDTGFHFTGGIPGCFEDMLKIAGVFDELQPVRVGLDLYFTKTDHRYTLPRGHEAVEDYLVSCFPEQAEGIRQFLQLERKIAETTPLFDVLVDNASIFNPAYGESDYFTLEEAMDRYQLSGEARAILCGSVTCHGTPPSEISLSGHCRINYGLYHDLLRFKGGGDSVVKALMKRTAELHVDFRRCCTVREFGALQGGGRVTSATLTDGSEIYFDSCIFTIHPSDILAYLPKEKVSDLFRERVNEFQETCGFTTVHCKVDQDVPGFREELCSVLSTENMNDAILCRNGENATGIMLSEETDSSGTPCRIATMFQSTPVDELNEWMATSTGQRGESYAAYKKQKMESILRDRLFRAYPQFEGHIQVLDCATQLTFRDWLSPTGSAYGIRQKMGQNNLFGRLPVRNFYVCGQSSMLPGVFGAMLSSLVLFRKMMGEDVYRNIVSEQLGRNS